MADNPEKELLFFRRHLFLPPGLPQQDDQDAALDGALLKLVNSALWDFGELVSERERVIVHYVARAIYQLLQTRDEDAGMVDEHELLKALRWLGTENDGKNIIF